MDNDIDLSQPDQVPEWPRLEASLACRSRGSSLLMRLQNYQSIMSPEQKERHAGKLLLDATAEIDRLIGICIHVHDRMLRGDDDMTLMQKLQDGWQRPNDQDQVSQTGSGPSLTPETPPNSEDFEMMQEWSSSLVTRLQSIDLRHAEIALEWFYSYAKSKIKRANESRAIESASKLTSDQKNL
jgi:hypothetical protein